MRGNDINYAGKSCSALIIKLRFGEHDPVIKKKKTEWAVVIASWITFETLSSLDPDCKGVLMSVSPLENV